jgi:hypothetical protein
MIETQSLVSTAIILRCRLWFFLFRAGFHHMVFTIANETDFRLVTSTAVMSSLSAFEADNLRKFFFSFLPFSSSSTITALSHQIIVLAVIFLVLFTSSLHPLNLTSVLILVLALALLMLLLLRPSSAALKVPPWSCALVLILEERWAVRTLIHQGWQMGMIWEVPIWLWRVEMWRVR